MRSINSIHCYCISHRDRSFDILIFNKKYVKFLLFANTILYTNS